MASGSRRDNGQGSLYHDASRDRWFASISVGPGKRRKWSAKTEAEAKRLLRKAIIDQAAGKLPSTDRQTVEQFLRQWHADMKPNLRPRIHVRYGQHIQRAIDAFGGKRLSHLTASDLQSLYRARLEAGASPTTVRHLHTVLHGAFKHGVEPLGPLPRNPCDGTIPPAMAHKASQTLTAAQVRRFLELSRNDRLHALYVLALTEAMREGELLGLRWRNVDFDRGMISVVASLQRVPHQGFVFTPPKTASGQRQVRLNHHALDALRRHKERQDAERLLARQWEDMDLVFPGHTGKPMDMQSLIQRQLYPALERYGLPHVTFHELRHSAATLLLERGVHPKIVSDLLGHSRVALTLDRYSHVGADIQLIAADAMDALLDE